MTSKHPSDNSSIAAATLPGRGSWQKKSIAKKCKRMELMFSVEQRI
jgi:hypothetical protein